MNRSRSRIDPHQLEAPFTSSQGASPAAAMIENEMYGIQADRLVCESYWDPHSRVSEQLSNLVEECCVPNWDGYGARALDPRVIEKASVVLDRLLDDFPGVEVSADPDGEVSLEWYADASHALSVSIGADGRMTYAALFGDCKAGGVEFLEDEVPEEIVAKLRRLFSTDRSSRPRARPHRRE